MRLPNLKLCWKQRRLTVRRCRREVSCDVVASLESRVYMFTQHGVVVCKMCPHDCFQSHMVGVEYLVPQMEERLRTQRRSWPPQNSSWRRRYEGEVHWCRRRNTHSQIIPCQSDLYSRKEKEWSERWSLYHCAVLCTRASRHILYPHAELQAQ